MKSLLPLLAMIASLMPQSAGQVPEGNAPGGIQEGHTDVFRAYTMLGRRAPLPFGNCRPAPRGWGNQSTGLESATAHLRPVQAAKLARRAARDIAQKEGVERARRRMNGEVA